MGDRFRENLLIFLNRAVLIPDMSKVLRSSDDKLLATTSNDGTVKVWNWESKNQLPNPSPKERESRVVSY